MATAGRRSASLRINLAPNGSGTAVTVVANFTASYLNPISNYLSERPCRSNGVVEAGLLNSAGS